MIFLKQISNFPNYCITKDGKVWSKKHQKFLKGMKNNSGHLRVGLYTKNGKRFIRYIHQLVLEMYVGTCPIGMQCRHLNGNPADNHLENLCWGSRSENAQDAIKHGTHNSLKCGEESPNVKLTKQDVKSIRKLYESKNFTQQQLADKFNISQSNISYIIRKETWL